MGPVVIHFGGDSLIPLYTYIHDTTIDVKIDVSISNNKYN
jgi:hypothetical protein